MVTLANVQGSSLVPDVSGSLNILLKTFGTKQSRDKEERERKEKEAKKAGIDTAIETIGSEGSSQEKIQAALLELTAIDPRIGTGARQVLERGDKQELQAAKVEIEQGKQDAFLISKEKTHSGKLNVLSQLAAKNALDGKDNSRIVELSQLPPELLDLELEKMQVTGSILDSAITESLKAAPETFEQILGPGGQPIAQRGSITGKEIASPRAGEPTDSPFGKVNPKDFTPASLEKFNKSGSFADLKPVAVEEQRTSLAKNLELAGIDPLSAEGKKIIKESIVKPGVKIDLNQGLDFKVPLGFKAVKDPETGKITGLEPVPGGPKDNLSGENAAKAQMLRTAQKAAEGIRKFVFDKEGEVNTGTLFAAAFNIPGTDGRELRNKMEFGIQAITRSETGAAMPAEEVDNTRERFMPSMLDSKRTIELKLQMFDEFLSGTLKLIDPTGRFNADRFNKELKGRGGVATDLREEAAVTEPGQTEQPISVDF